MASTLHIPRPPNRPGDKPNFNHLRIPAAGSQRRPDPSIAASDCRDLATGLIRVLNEENESVGEWDPKLTPEFLRKGLRDMLLTRTFDARMFKMQRQGKISVYFGSTGEEAVSVAQSMALEAGDMLFPAYRQQGILINRGISLVDLMCQCLSNSRDKLQGRQLPGFYCFKDVDFFTLSGNLGTQFPQAVGWSMAAQCKGSRDVAASWIGEGSSAGADFHYALTFASVYRSPVLLTVVNNQWAISTYQNIAGGLQDSFAARGIGYGIPGLRVDGNDFLAVFAATQWATRRARDGGGPTLVELYTYRAGPHSTSDDPARYRPHDECEVWPLGDPITRLKKYLIQLKEWSEEQHSDLEQELAQHVKQCWQEAISFGTLADGPWAPVGAMFDDVYRQIPEQLEKQRQELLGSQP